MASERLASIVRKLAIPLLLVSLSLFSVQVSQALDELVKNGDFETKNLNGWTYRNSKVVLDSGSTPSHSGKYSARIGDGTREGYISQTVSIPAKSAAQFKAWYRIEKGAALSIFLKSSDGSIIKQFDMQPVLSWASLAFNLDISYAGKTITIEFDGRGYTESYTVWGTCVDPFTGQLYSCPWTEYNYFHAYVDDVSMTSAIAVYETVVSITGLPQELSTGLFVDNQQVEVISAGKSVVRTFNIGERHVISVESYVSKDDRTRYYCAYNSRDVSSGDPVTFSYGPQYLLSVNSEYGQTAGGGWYDEGATQTFSADRTVPGPTGVDYLIVPYSITYVFDHWTGDSSSANPSDSIRMDGPKTVTAVWKIQKSYNYTYLVALIGVVMAGTATTYWAISKRKRPLKSAAEPATGAVKEELKEAKEEAKGTEVQIPGVEPAQEEKGVVSLIEKLEKSYRGGSVSERAYKKLREDYEKRLADIRARKSNPSSS